MRTYKPGITCVTLSKEPFKHTGLPANVQYINSVQTFQSIKDYYKYWIAAVQQVQTAVFFVQDYDDPLPNLYPGIVDGIYHGDYVEIDHGRKIRHSTEKYSKRNHIEVPSLIHKAFCNTKAVHAILEHLPKEGNLLPEGAVYYPLIHCYGRVYDKSLEMAWVDHAAGLHHQGGSKALIGTRNFLARHGEVICARVAQDKERLQNGYSL